MNKSTAQLIDFERKAKNHLGTISLTSISGEVKRVTGTQIFATVPDARIGDLCEIIAEVESENILAEVVGFDESGSILASLSPPEGVSYGNEIKPLFCKHQIELTGNIFGNVYDGMGRLLSDPSVGIFSRDKNSKTATKVIADAVAATSKPRISDPIETGIKVIDGFLSIGEGQRLGLFAGAGCGKTTLLASLARGCKVDAIVFCLVGERGRELNEFLTHELDDEIKARSILVCATSDKSSMERSRAAFTATAIAESMRDEGKKVLLLVDSLTRFARAQREIGLASGEPPAQGGYPPSVYAMLPRLIERAGKTHTGSITAIYTLLLEGDSMKDPIGDEAKSLLDGHIVLNRKFAERGQYPAVDVLQSLSRTMTNVVDKNQMECASILRGLLSRYDEMELLLRLGEYTIGQDDYTDWALRKNPEIVDFLKQHTHEIVPFEKSAQMLEALSVR